MVLTIMSAPDEAEMQLDAVERPKMYQEVKEADKNLRWGAWWWRPGEELQPVDECLGGKSIAER